MSASNTKTLDPRQELERLYNLAFDKHKARALWNMKRIEHPTREEALVIARALRIEGNLEARQLAEDMEALARAD